MAQGLVEQALGLLIAATHHAVNAGFRLLATYIFGNNTVKQSIAITAPETVWLIQFVMPKTHSLQSLPSPNDARVHFAMTRPTHFAVVRFSGLAGDADIAQKTADLSNFMDGHQLRRAGPPTLVRYDPPWTLWFLRRNEIMVPIQPTDVLP